MPRTLFSTRSSREAVKTSKVVLGALIQRAISSKQVPVAVFDVDETLLLNHSEDEGKAASNPPIKELHDWLVGRGVTIFVVTARRKTDWSHGFLSQQLSSIGYPPRPGPTW